MAKQEMADALQATHEAACKTHAEKKREDRKPKAHKPQAQPKPDHTAGRAAQAAKTAGRAVQTAHELETKARGYTDQVIGDLKKLLTVDEGDVGPYAKGLLKQALAQNAALHEVVKGLESRLTALEAEAMRQYDDADEELLEEFGTAFGKALASAL